MNRVKLPFPAFLASSLLLTLATPALALPEDRNQVIRGTADTLVVDQKIGESTYSGSVRIEQGSLVITADIIKVRTRPDGSPDKIVATGSPARFQQQPNLDQKVIVATAKSITYTPDNEHLLLVEEAAIEQDGQVMKAPHINYDLINEVMKAKQIDGARVDIYIPPKTEAKH